MFAQLEWIVDNIKLIDLKKSWVDLTCADRAGKVVSVLCFCRIHKAVYAQTTQSCRQFQSEAAECRMTEHCINGDTTWVFDRRKNHHFKCYFIHIQIWLFQCVEATHMWVVRRVCVVGFRFFFLMLFDKQLRILKRRFTLATQHIAICTELN